MVWIIIIAVFLLLIFIISKSGPIENKTSNKITKKEVEFNLSEYPNQYSFDVRGVHLDDYMFPILNYSKEFDLITLIPEPDNNYDSDAIKVINSGWHIGYVPTEDTYDVNKILNKDSFIYIEKLDKDPGFINVSIKIRFKN